MAPPAVPARAHARTQDHTRNVSVNTSPESLTEKYSDPNLKEVDTEEQPITGPFTDGAANSAKAIDAAAHNDVLGQNQENVAKYKNLSSFQCGVLLIAETISLGILSLPKVVATVGWLPGMALIIGFGLVSTYTGYVLYQLKRRFPALHSFADAGALVMGKPGRIILELLQFFVFIFLMAAHVLTFGIMMNVLTGHGTCTIIFAVVGTIVSLLCTMPRTLKNISYLSAISCLSIITAVIVTMIGVGVKVPSGDIITHIIPPAGSTSYIHAYIAVADIVVAYTAQLTFFGFIAELRDPKDFPKSLAMLQVTTITLYVIVAAVIYHFAGPAVKSPALGSAPALFMKAAYGIAIPTIIVAGVINAHVCAKNIYVHIFKKNPGMLSERSLKSYGTWVAILVTLWTLAFIIAEAIPVFGQLLGLIGALFCSWFTLGLPAIFWFWMRQNEWLGEKGEDGTRGPVSRSTRFWMLFALNVLIVCISLGVCGLGTWGSAVAIRSSAKAGGTFSCADNSL